MGCPCITSDKCYISNRDLTIIEINDSILPDNDFIIVSENTETDLKYNFK